jgi:hypothetical protein
MIRFAEKPDEIFLTILREAIDEESGYIEDSAHDAQFFEGSYPLSSRHFTPALAVQTLQRLKTASEAQELYILTDYHWELLYEVLRGYTDLFNDQEATTSVLPEKYGIKEISFSDMIGKFFRDNDFMQDADSLLGLTSEQKEALGYSEEFFGMTQGLLLSPNPKELEIRRVQEDKEGEQIVDSVPRSPSPVYPYVSFKGTEH